MSKKDLVVHSVKATENLVSANLSKTSAVLNYADGFGSLVTAWQDYQNTREVEITRREQIAANRDVKLSAIREQAAILQMMIKETFKERERNFDKYFSLLNDGFVNGNEMQINAALNMLVEQTKINPMVQTMQLINSINDPDVKVIEI
ncbi:hypothetical protein [Lampropedia hyalina]|jgi:hypothetical protein|uniref:hypothetical protein n=1 Tax=Lampropedia hyalina TaxID=198706 RepID=UPI0011612EDD|nr:hypothetical protein [Lampropedia hyalina]